MTCRVRIHSLTPIASFMGPTWGPSGAYRTQVGPMLAPWTLLSGEFVDGPITTIIHRNSSSGISGPLCTMHESGAWMSNYIPHYHTDALTHWGRVTHICVSKSTIIGSDNGLSPGQRQAIIWTNAGILLIRTLGTNFSEILIEITTFSFKKMHLKVSSEKRRPFCLGHNVLMQSWAIPSKIWDVITHPSPDTLAWMINHIP